MPIKLIIFLSIFIWSLPAGALTLEKKLENPQLEKLANEIFREIRCMVCQGESIADSRVELAQDLRHKIRMKLQNNHSKTQIKDSLVKAYGHEILMTPPINHQTIILWFGPFIILIFSLVVLFKHINSKSN